MDSHNISNIEEFINDLDFQSLHDKFQNTQRLTSRRDLREDLTDGESLKLSWTKLRPLNRELKLQFEIKLLGSHLDTPNFQQTNRSHTILQEKKINNPIAGFEIKRSALINKALKVSENHDPNKHRNTQQTTNHQQQQPHMQDFSDDKASQTLTLKDSTEDFSQLKSFRIQNKPINNFQRFSASQKNPLFKVSQK